MPAPSMFSRWLGELRRHGVLRVLASYALAVFVLLQVAEITFEPLGLPDRALTLVIVLVIVGFPIAVGLAWVLDITPSRGPGDTVRTGPSGRDASTSKAASSVPSVAVLPFEDMSPEGDQAFFCDGVAEEILNRLVHIESLRVASRTSSFRFKGERLDVEAIAHRLKVDAVLEGSVRKAGDRLRVTTQLINGSDGYHLWSESFDRELSDVFAIQEEIAQSVAEAMEVKLAEPVALGYGTTDVEAYEFFLKGGHYFRRWGLRNVEFAIEMFQRAVEIDPAYARAWAALADSYSTVSMYWDATEANLNAAEHASRRVLELAPDLAEAHVARGLYHITRGEPELADERFGRALELHPRLFEALYFYGRVCFQQGKLWKAAEFFERAEKVRPEDFQTPILLRQVYRSLGREDDALQAARRGVDRATKHLELNPDDTRALELGFGGLIDLEEWNLGTAWAERALALDGDNPHTLYNVACGFARMGEPDRAVDCLERASLRGVTIADWAENDSDLDSLRGDPRFQAVLADLRARKTQLPDEDHG